MDDYSLVSLSDSKNEWCARLVNTLTPSLIEGLKSIFEESWALCIENDEEDKYLMTFQTFLSRIPKWNSAIIDTERKRIEDTTSCGYLEELITCVHVIQLKALTCARVGNKQKKVNINIPSVNTFIHKTYCNVARKLYTSIYLFEKDILPLEIQKHNRELECIIKESILNTVRDTMPIEDILRAYMDETEELDVNEEFVIIKETPSTDPIDIGEDVGDNTMTNVSPVVSTEVIPHSSPKVMTPVSSLSKETLPSPRSASLAPALHAPALLAPASIAPALLAPASLAPASLAPASLAPASLAPASLAPASLAPASLAPASLANAPAPTLFSIPSDERVKDRVNFNDVDNRVDINGKIDTVIAPKTDERLDKIAELSAERRRREEEEEDDEDKIKIGGDVDLQILDINDLNRSVTVNPVLDDIEVLT
jgi:hypothetical protein